MAEVVVFLAENGWRLRRHLRCPKAYRRENDRSSEVGLDRFQFVHRSGAVVYSNTRAWFVENYVKDKENLLKKIKRSAYGL